MDQMSFGEGGDMVSGSTSAQDFRIFGLARGQYPLGVLIQVVTTVAAQRCIQIDGE